MSRGRTQLDASVYARVFEQHAEGAMVLEELERRFSAGPVYSGGIDGIRKSDNNAGARSVIEFIALKINQAHGVHDDVQDEG